MLPLCQRTRHMLWIYGSCCGMKKWTKDLLYIWNNSFSRKAFGYQMCTSNDEFHSRYRHWKESGAVRPVFDMEHVIKNVREISNNNLHRKGDADVYHVIECWKKLKEIEEALNKLEQEIGDLELKIKDKKEEGGTFNSKKMELLNHQKEMKLLAEKHEHNYYEAALRLPNRTHPESPVGEESQSRIIHTEGEKAKFSFPIQGHIELGENLDILRIKNIGNVAGNRSYYLKGVGAQLEEALTRYTMERLLQRGFQLLSVPDLIKPVVFEGCGMRTKGEHTQVYWLDPQQHPQDLCLAGTGEVGLAGYFINKVLTRADLPQRVMTTSRCYRAETAHSADARGLYRVHQFTKVEMFGVTSQDSGEESAELFEEYSSIQRQLFSDLGLHFHVLDMPSEELGASAYRKYDIEAWMPYRNSYGEISSTSNCTDFQSRRLNIMYEKSDSETEYVHTINGTACAIPRMIVAILENFQRADGSIAIPSVLQPYMCGQSVITKPSGGLLHYTRL